MTRPSFATDSRTAERVRRRGSLRVVDPEEARQRLVAEKSRVEGLIAEVREELGTGSEGEELSEGGLGIAIIRSIADEFEIDSKLGARGSRLRFVKILT